MGRQVSFESNGKAGTAIIDSIGARHTRIKIDDLAFECELVQKTGNAVFLRVGSHTITVHEVSKGEYVIGSRLITVSGRQQVTANRSEAENAGILKAVMPGMVVKIMVQQGQEVETGTPVLVLEAMKMENEVKSLGKGKVKAIRVNVGDTVDTGAVLVEFE